MDYRDYQHLVFERRPNGVVPITINRFFKRHMATKGTELAEACVAIIGQLAAVA